jgi:hypothetical protein
MWWLEKDIWKEWDKAWKMFHPNETNPREKLNESFT